MKKTVKLSLILCIVCLISALILTSCDLINEPKSSNQSENDSTSKKNDNGEENIKQGIVTEEQWASAFAEIPKNVESKISLENGTVYIYKLYNNITYSYALSNGTKTEETYVEGDYYYEVEGSTVTKYKFSDNAPSVEIDTRQHFSFDQFTYDAKSNSYKADKISITDSSSEGMQTQFEYTNNEIKFVDGKLTYHSFTLLTIMSYNGAEVYRSLQNEEIKYGVVSEIVIPEVTVDTTK